ncbi:hypothetical protein D3C78_1106580 [compost metagenome]
MARSKRNCSSWRVTSASVRCRAEMIQRSTEDSSTGSSLTPVSWPSVFSMTKLAAFHSLLQKLR